MGERQKPLKIRVTFPNGKVICYAIVERTLIETLKEIGSSRFHMISLEVGHLPLITREKHSKYGEWMKPVVDGWYLNTQSDTNQKYMQLVAIKQQLHLDIKVEIGRDFETQSFKTGATRNKQRDYLQVELPNRPSITTEPYIVYYAVLKDIGFEEIKKKKLSIQDQKLITPTKQYDKQLQTDDYQWVTLPPKESLVIKWLGIVASVMNYRITLTDMRHNKKYIFPVQSEVVNIIKKVPVSQYGRWPHRKIRPSATLETDRKAEVDKPIETVSRKVTSVEYDKRKFSVNDKVKHPVWGTGVISEITLGGSLIGVNFGPMNTTFVKPETLGFAEEKEYPKKDVKPMREVESRSHQHNISSKQLYENAQKLRRMMRFGELHIGDRISTPKYGIGIITHVDSFKMKASFNNIVRDLFVGKDFIEKLI